MGHLERELNDLARDKCRIALDEYKQKLAKLEVRPNSLKDFAGFVDTSQTLEADAKRAAKETSVVEDMYRILHTNEVRVSHEDMVQLDDLKAAQIKYVEQAALAEDYIYDQMSGMTQSLDMNIAHLNEQVMVVQKELLLEGSDFENVRLAGTPHIVLEKLSHINRKLTHLRNTSREFSRYQELFGKTVYTYKTLRETTTIFEQRFKLWDSLRTWRHDEEKWMNDDFRSMDIDAFNDCVTRYFKDANLLHRKINNEVTALLLDHVEKFRAKMPTIVELGNSAMKDRHWARVYAECMPGEQWTSGLRVKLVNLEEDGCFSEENIAKISEISSAASGEQQIEKSIQDIEDSWMDAAFVTAPYRDSRDVYILSGLDDVYTLLEDNQVALQTMTGSPFVAGVKDDVTVWEKKLSVLSQTLDEWSQCQRTWMYLETIFAAPDIQGAAARREQGFSFHRYHLERHHALYQGKSSRDRSH